MDGILKHKRTRLRALMHAPEGDVETFCAGLDFERFMRWPLGRRIEAVVKAVYGLGYAKTAFALTCAGYADIPCLDVWALRKRLGVERRAWRNARAYLVDCAVAFGPRGGGYRHWEFYYHLDNGAGRAFRRTSHAPVFVWLGVDAARPAQGRLMD